MKKKLQKDWMLGFLGIFGFNGIPEIITQDWFGTLWILWFIWFIKFIPRKQ